MVKVAAFFILCIMAASNFNVSTPLTFCCANINSSGSGDGKLKISDQKIFNLKQIDTDILTLCDTRLGPDGLHHKAFGKIFNYVKNPFDFYGHAPRSNRGVGILFRRGLDYQIHETLKIM